MVQNDMNVPMGRNMIDILEWTDLKCVQMMVVCILTVIPPIEIIDIAVRTLEDGCCVGYANSESAPDIYTDSVLNTVVQHLSLQLFNERSSVGGGIRRMPKQQAEKYPRLHRRLLECASVLAFMHADTNNTRTTFADTSSFLLHAAISVVSNHKRAHLCHTSARMTEAITLTTHTQSNELHTIEVELDNYVTSQISHCAHEPWRLSSLLATLSPLFGKDTTGAFSHVPLNVKIMITNSSDHLAPSFFFIDMSKYITNNCSPLMFLSAFYVGVCSARDKWHIMASNVKWSPLTLLPPKSVGAIRESGPEELNDLLALTASYPCIEWRVVVRNCLTHKDEDISLSELFYMDADNASKVRSQYLHSFHYELECGIMCSAGPYPKGVAENNASISLVSRGDWCVKDVVPDCDCIYCGNGSGVSWVLTGYICRSSIGIHVYVTPTDTRQVSFYTVLNEDVLINHHCELLVNLHGYPANPREVVQIQPPVPIVNFAIDQHTGVFWATSRKASNLSAMYRDCTFMLSALMASCHFGAQVSITTMVNHSPQERSLKIRPTFVNEVKQRYPITTPAFTHFTNVSVWQIDKDPNATLGKVCGSGGICVFEYRMETGERLFFSEYGGTNVLISLMSTEGTYVPKLDIRTSAGTHTVIIGHSFLVDNSTVHTSGWMFEKIGEMVHAIKMGSLYKLCSKLDISSILKQVASGGSGNSGAINKGDENNDEKEAYCQDAMSLCSEVNLIRLCFAISFDVFIPRVASVIFKCTNESERRRGRPRMSPPYSDISIGFDLPKLSAPEGRTCLPSPHTTRELLRSAYMIRSVAYGNFSYHNLFWISPVLPYHYNTTFLLQRTHQGIAVLHPHHVHSTANAIGELADIAYILSNHSRTLSVPHYLQQASIYRRLEVSWR